MKDNKTALASIREYLLEALQDHYDQSDITDIEGYTRGFLAAVTVFNIPHPNIDPGDIVPFQNWMTRKVLTATMMTASTEADLLCDQLLVPKSQFRAMLFNCGRIDDYGNELDLDTGEKTDQHHDWEDIVCVRDCDGYILPAHYYKKDVPQEPHHIVRILRINTGNGLPFTIRSDDQHLMAALIRHDISIGDPINQRYDRDAKNPHSELSHYATVIQGALSKLPYCDHSYHSCTVQKL